MKIEVRFLGVPQILLDGERINLKQKKLFAILLYVLYHTACSRDELADVFWCDLNEENARQNLRNALYRLKKNLKQELLVSKDIDSVTLHPELQIERDIDVLLAEDGGPRLLDFKSFVFLEKLYLRDTQEFDRWVSSMRVAYEKIVVNRLENNMRENCRASGQIAEKYAKKLLEISPYHEEACRGLIEWYCSRGLYGEAIQTYIQLELRLGRDLGLEPEEKTRNAYQIAKEMRGARERSQQNWLASPQHEQIRDTFVKEYNRFLLAQGYCHCIVQGMLGTGKSQIIENFVQSVEEKIFLRVRFEAANADIPFYAIGKILPLLADAYGLRLSEPNYNDSESLKLYYVISMDKLVSRMKNSKEKVLLLLENMEAIDRRSLGLLFSYLFDQSRCEVMIAGEYCTSFSQDFQPLRRLDFMENVCVCRLAPLNRQDSVAYLSSHMISQESEVDLVEIASRTGGVLMILEDVSAWLKTGGGKPYVPSDVTLKNLSVLFSSMSGEETKCLELLSVFRFGADLEVLTAITDWQPVELTNVIEQLHRRELVAEETYETHLLVRISADIVRDVIYNGISRLRRVELHRLAARFYEKGPHAHHGNYHCLRELKYHYQMSGHPYKQVYYALQELWYRLDYSDDFFPTIQSNPELLGTFYLSRHEAYRIFASFEMQLGQLADGITRDQMCELNMIYDYLKGRTMIRDSRSAEGLVHIRSAVALAKQLKREDMLLKGYMEVVFSGIKTENVGLMRDYIKKARQIADFADYDNERGILLRLEALCDIMSKAYARAEKLLLRSIEILISPKLRDHSYVNVAAAYDYLGLIYRVQGDYGCSKEYFERAIALCLRHNVSKSLDLFYEDLGYTLFLQGDYMQAKENFIRSSEIYNQFDNYWLRSIGESCMSMILADEGEPDIALEYFRRAEIYSRKDHTEEELAVLARARKKLESLGIL